MKYLKQLLKNDVTSLLLRLLLLYIIWFLARMVFYWQNAAAIGPIVWNEIPELFRGACVFDTVSLLYANIVFIFFSLLPFRFRENRWYQKGLFWLFTVTNGIGLFVNVADGIYFHFARKRFTADEFSYLENNDNTATIFWKSLGENWYIFLWYLLLMALLVWGYRKVPYWKSAIRRPWNYFASNLLILALAVGLIIGAIRGGFDRQTRPITLSNATGYTSSNLKANLILSNPFCIIRTLGNKGIHYTKFYDQPTLDSLYTPYHYPVDRNGIEQKNVVIFILESFSAEHSALLNPDLYPDGDGYTPFLDSLMQQGFYFRNAFSNGRKSIDALPSVFSSIPSYQTPFVLMPRALSETRALPLLLKEQGYNTLFFNGSSKGSMGFGAYAALAGVEQYYSRENYEAKHGKNDFDGFWGVWDEPFLQYMAATLNEIPEPFFSSVFTLTSHHPFVIPKKYETVLPTGRTKVHPGVTYTDMSVRKFMEQAKKQPWYANTIFVFVADHVSSETFAPKTLTPTGNTHILYFLYAPSVTIPGTDDQPLHGFSEAVTQQIDIMPTVLGLLRYDQPYFAFGRDFFNETDGTPMATNFFEGNYQGITDSLVLFFNGRETVSAHRRNDSLQLYDISANRSVLLEETEKLMKARLQQYYQHVEKGDYLVKPQMVSDSAFDPENLISNQ